MPIYYIHKLIVQNNTPFCDIRDYDVRDAIARKKTIRVVYEERGEYCDLDWKQLKKKTIFTKELMPSQFGRPYHLWSYPWVGKPIKISDEEFQRRALLNQ